MAATHQFTVFRGDKAGNIKSDTTKRNLNANEVLIRITHSGLCGTDCHYRQSGIALGHEGVGVVEATGEAAKKFKKGDVVGWGYQHKSCGECQKCLSGNEVYCEAAEMYGFYNTDQGSLATHAVWREAYIFAIPSELAPANAAPLMCAGATVFSPLFLNNVNATHTVGVVGIGGLGHLAIQFAAKMGCRVVAFSSTEDKHEEALKLGASEFYATRGKDKLEVTHKLDYLLISTNQASDAKTWGIYLDIMKTQGTIFPLTVSFGEMNIPYGPFLMKAITIAGNLIAPRWVHNIMLEFAARHKVQAMIEEFPMTEEGITEAFDKLDNGKLRYRAVLRNKL